MINFYKKKAHGFFSSLDLRVILYLTLPIHFCGMIVIIGASFVPARDLFVTLPKILLQNHVHEMFIPLFCVSGVACSWFIDRALTCDLCRQNKTKLNYALVKGAIGKRSWSIPYCKHKEMFCFLVLEIYHLDKAWLIFIEKKLLIISFVMNKRFCVQTWHLTLDWIAFQS